MKAGHEDILIKALEMYDEGTPVQDICAHFSAYRAELEQMFQMIGALQRTKEKAVPSRHLLNTILKQRSITAGDANRYVQWSWLKVAIPLVSGAFVLMLFLSGSAPQAPNAPLAFNEVGEETSAKMMIAQDSAAPSAESRMAQFAPSSAGGGDGDATVDQSIDEIESAPVEDGSESDEEIYAYMDDPAMNEFDSTANDGEL